MALEHVIGARYVVPLREGGSLPAVVETVQPDQVSPGGAFVVKFQGAGQGAKALIAEAVVAGLARALDLPVPRPAIVTLEEGFGNAEPDPEIQDILQGSVGENFGLAYLSGALAFDPAVDAAGVDPDLAAEIVWLDALTTNVDRTPRNTNMLLWHHRLWLIDHGAALYVHHATGDPVARAPDRFAAIRDHVLLPFAGSIAEADARLAPKLDRARLEAIAGELPEGWGDPEAYAGHLAARLEHREGFVEEAEDARS